ncbi:unnamed protein product [Rotaria sp. Silwood1]|nr:unnamed protein product [Rotaria sp. Silwood1]
MQQIPSKIWIWYQILWNWDLGLDLFGTGFGFGGLGLDLDLDFGLKFTKSERNPDDEIIHPQDEWQYQNSITGQWYHWTTYNKQNNHGEWRVKWLNVAPTSYLGVIVYLTTTNELNPLKTSLTQLSRLLSNNPRPVVIFHEGDFDADDIQKSLSNILGNHTPLGFERIRFSDNANRPRSVFPRWPLKYFHMCRFFTLMLPNHPLLTLFTYYWRLDAHSYIFGPKPIEDPFEIMQKRHIQYAFIMANEDDDHYAVGLWSFFHEFLDNHCLKPSIALRQTQTGWFGGYSLAIIFTNFAIANVSLFRDHSLIRAWLHAVDRNGGIYRYRWGDAPIHTLALTQFLSQNHIVRLRYFGYMHRHEYTCASNIERDLCKAQVKSFLTQNGIRYSYYQDGCFPSTQNPLCHYYPEIKLNPDDEIIHPQDEWQYQNSITGQWYHWTTTYNKQNKYVEWRVKWLNVAPTSYLGVIVYLTTTNELNPLKTSLTQLSRLLSNNPRPVVIFHEGDFDADDIQKSLSNILGNHTPLGFERIRFSNHLIQPRPVGNHRWPLKYTDMCRFFTLMLVNHPLLTLFTYYWRLDAHSYIFGPKPIEDPFEMMQKRQIQYAFIMASEEADYYAVGLWSFFHEFLDNRCLKPSIALRQTQTDLFGNYSLYIIFTNFAIANVSLFRDHSLIRAWLHAVDRNGGIYRYRWGDAPIHTLILTQFLSQNHIVRLRYFGYMHQREYICADGIKGEVCKAQVKPFLAQNGIEYLYYQDGCHPSPRNPLCHYYPEIKL